MAVVITVVLPIFSGPPAEKPRSAVAKQDKREEKPLTVELLHPTEEWCRRAGDPGCCPTVSGWFQKPDSKKKSADGPVEQIRCAR